VRSEWAGSYLFDYAIHILYSSDAYATKLIRTLLGRTSRSRSAAPGLLPGRLHAYPFQANTYGLPVPVVKECVMG